MHNVPLIVFALLPAFFGSIDPTTAGALECLPNPLDAITREETVPEGYEADWLKHVRCLAEHGDAEVKLKMGIAYRDDRDGPPQDYLQAHMWFNLAATRLPQGGIGTRRRAFENRDLVISA